MASEPSRTFVQSSQWDVLGGPPRAWKEGLWLEGEKSGGGQGDVTLMDLISGVSKGLWPCPGRPYHPTTMAG